MDNQPDTRERLLRAAIAVLASEGERAIRVRDIAAQAGVTEPSLYHFFGSREGLIIAAQATRFREDQIGGIAELTAAVHACQSPGDFAAVVRTTLEWAYQPDRRVARATRVDVLGSAMSRPDLAHELAAAQRRVNEELAEVLGFAQTQGWMRPDIDCVVLAAWVMGQISGRIFIEIDPELADAKDWNEISITGVIAALGIPSTTDTTSAATTTPAPERSTSPASSIAGP